MSIINETKKTIVRCENVKIKSVTSPDQVSLIAKERGLNPQEVFIRIVFEYNDMPYKASNKLRFLTKEGYKTLIEKCEKEEPITISVNTENEFFYIEYGTKIDDLFSTPVEKERYTNDLMSLLV